MRRLKKLSLFVVAPVLVAVAGAVAVAGGSPLPGGERVLSGVTPAGTRYELSASRGLLGRSCQELRLGEDGDGSEHCQPSRGEGMRGFWQLDCRVGQLFAYGTAYAGTAGVEFVRAAGGRVPARFVGSGDRRVFLVAVGRDDLPGELRATGATGAMLSKLRFATPAEECADEGIPNPLEVFYDF